MKTSPLGGKITMQMTGPRPSRGESERGINHRVYDEHLKSCKHQSVSSYSENRGNGDTRDNPDSTFPKDGKYDREHSEIQYTEGPKDRAWMEEKDRNYILRLAREGLLLELEPNADREIAEDHKYREEITRALEDARESKSAAEEQAKEKVERKARRWQEVAEMKAELEKLCKEMEAEKIAWEQELLEDCKCACCEKIMLDPVLAADGEVYEREEIETWLRNHDTSPCTKKALSSKNLIPRAAIKRKIARFMDKHPEFWLTDEVYTSEKLVQCLIKAVQDKNSDEVASIVGTDKRLLTRKIVGEQHLLVLALNSTSSPEVVQTIVTALDTKFDELMEIKADGGIEFFRIAAVNIGTTAAKIIADRSQWQQSDIQKQFEYAVENNEIRLAAVCLDLGANLEVVDINGMRPLHRVIDDGKYEKHDLIKLFIERGASRSAVNSAGNAALHLAVLKNDATAVEILLSTKETPRKVEKAASLPNFINTLNPQSHLSALHLALNALHVHPDQEHFTLVQLLVNAGANLELFNAEGDTMLLQAIRIGNEQLLELVLMRPTNPVNKEARDSKQNTALHLALTLNNRDFAQKLLTTGANIEALLPPENDTALLHVVRSHQPEFLALILANQPKPNLEVMDQHGNTALHLAFNLGFLDLIPQLIAAGADLEKKDADGNTALLRAANARQLDLVRLMAERREYPAELNAKNNLQENALHIAARQGDEAQDYEMALFLLDYGVEGLALNAQGKKPQEVAFEAHNLRIAAVIDNKILDLRLQQHLGKRHVSATEVASKENFYWLEIPRDFICPITQTMMDKPVVAADGNSYEKEAIERWLVYNRTSPLDRSMLAHTMLIPNKTLKKAIDAFKTQLSETQAKRVAEERTRRLGEDFQLAVKLRENEIEDYSEILQEKEKCRAAERLALEKEVKIGEQALAEKTRTIEIAKKAMQNMLENKEQFEKKLEQALDENSTVLITEYQSKLEELKKQLEERDTEKTCLESERLELLQKQMELVEQNQESLGKLDTRVTSLTDTVEKIENQLAEKANLERENQERQERTIKALDEKVQELQSVGVRNTEQETLLGDLLAAKNAETLKVQRRTEFFAQERYPQLKDFYLSIQLLLNRVLKADEVKATGDFATQNTTKKEKAASIVKICGRAVPILGIAITSASEAVKSYAEKRKRGKASDSMAVLPPDTLYRETMVEEIAFGLCEHYENQLKALGAGTDEESQAAISKLADTAIQRMHAYLQAQETLEPDPVIALINAVRTTKIKGDRQIKIIDKPVCPDAVTSSTDIPLLVPDHWTAHGFFSQSGIRTSTPRRRHFDFEAPSLDALKKKRTADGIYYTDVQRYGYAQGSKEDARLSGMVPKTLRP